MSYRPITDVWILARSKVRYYGAYPAGFVSRARALLGVQPGDQVLHLCSGKVKDYPFAGIGPIDITADIDPELKPDFLWDVRSPWPEEWPLKVHAILSDPPYTEDDADHYNCGRSVLPTGAHLFARATELLNLGGRIGILHYQWFKPPIHFKNIAVVTVLVGFNNRARLYSVYERVA